MLNDLDEFTPADGILDRILALATRYGKPKARNRLLLKG